MKKSENKLDRWLRGLFQDAAFGTMEEDWQAISARLDKQKRRRNILIPVVVLALFLAALSMLLFKAEKKKTQLSSLQALAPNPSLKGRRESAFNQPFGSAQGDASLQAQEDKKTNIDNSGKQNQQSKPFGYSSKKYKKNTSDNAVLYQ